VLKQQLLPHTRSPAGLGACINVRNSQVKEASTGREFPYFASEPWIFHVSLDLRFTYIKPDASPKPSNLNPTTPTSFHRLSIVTAAHSWLTPIPKPTTYRLSNVCNNVSFELCTTASKMTTAFWNSWQLWEKLCFVYNYPILSRETQANEYDRCWPVLL